MPPIHLLEKPVEASIDTEIPISPVTSTAQTPGDHADLSMHARSLRHTWRAPERLHASTLAARWKAANLAIIHGCRMSVEPLAEHSALLYEAARNVKDAVKSMSELPHVETQDGTCVPRIYAATDSFLQAVHFDLQSDTLLFFFAALQENDFFFRDKELHALQPSLQLALLEKLGEKARESTGSAPLVREPGDDSSERALRSLRLVAKLDWNSIFAALSEIEHVLCQDPAGAYAQMDIESRSQYRTAVAEFAEHSVWNEAEIAREAVKLASAPQEVADPRAMQRRSHVGYYLLDQGRKIIEKRAGYRATAMERTRAALRRWPTLSYLSAIAAITGGILAAVCAGAGVSFAAPGRAVAVLLVVFIPVTECAIAIANLVITRIFKPERLPRIDYSAGIPDECATLVAIPMLMSSEKQVRQAVKDLEIRYVGNRDKNLHFALVTDLPDSLYRFDSKDALAPLCSSLIEELNEKYARRGAGSFIHLHRHRAYNFAEKIWMGWETQARENTRSQ